MTVTASFPVLQRPWRGYEDPGLPVGMWISQGTILGDVSGGNQVVNLVFKEEGAPLGARFYNIEQLEVHESNVSTRNAGLVMQSFDIIGQTGLVNREIHLELDVNASSNSALTGSAVRLPIFVGRPSLVGITSQLQFRTVNIDGDTFFVTAQGYIWEPRSLLNDGGLRRPLDGLYG